MGASRHRGADPESGMTPIPRVIFGVKTPGKGLKRHAWVQNTPKFWGETGRFLPYLGAYLPSWVFRAARPKEPGAAARGEGRGFLIINHGF